MNPSINIFTNKNHACMHLGLFSSWKKFASFAYNKTSICRLLCARIGLRIADSASLQCALWLPSNKDIGLYAYLTTIPQFLGFFFAFGA